MILHFLFPAWFLLIFPTAWALWKWRAGSALLNTIRAAFFLSLILALAQPRLKFESLGGVLAVVADRSKSLPEGARERQAEILKLLEKEKGDRDQIAVVGFSDKVCVEQLPDTGDFDAFKGYYSGNASRLADALDMAVSLVPKDRHGRVLILSDGRHTGMSPLELESIGNKKNMPVDFRMMSRPTGKDLSIIDINLPANVEEGETFQFAGEIFVPERATVSYALRRDGRKIASGKIDFAPGRRIILFQDRIEKAGNARYALEISSPLPDATKENNYAEAMTSAKGARAILHVGPFNSRLLNLADKGGLKIVHKSAIEMDWSINGLSKFKAVILENTPAIKLGFEGQEALKNFVELGGGLMVSGGRQSFGIGGYYKTPVADVLPISMELRREHRKLTTAVIVALDRSGSMSMPVPGGRTKMDLANQGTASALELLSDSDYFGVLAVDSRAHVIVNATKISGSRDGMEHRIRAIKSMGGGIFVYEALHHAAKMLLDIEAGARHIILFADAADSEEPGKYKELLNKLRANGITASVIGLGTEKDCDADLLKDIAKRGEGNIYFSNSAKELPQLFAQETLTVFRGAFVEEATPVKRTADLSLICDMPLSKPPPIGGFNLTYLKQKASLGLVTDDENKAPVLAFHSCGAGRCLAFVGEIDGKFTGAFGSWDKSGEIYLSCLRWINASATDEDEDLFINANRAGADVTVTIELDPLRTKNSFLKAPRLIHLRETAAGIVKEIIPFKWKERDVLVANASLDGKESSHFYVSVQKTSDKEEKIIPCSSMCLPYPQEHVPELDPHRGAKVLLRIAELTGGKERVSFDGIFKNIPPFARYIPIWHYLALISLAALVLEVACRRMGINFNFRPRPSADQKRATQTKKKASLTIKQESENETAKENSSGSVLGAISKAKEKSRKRMK